LDNFTEQVGHEMSRPAAAAAMTLVVDRMREMLQENERLHATIADLRTRQEHTENRLALLENAGSGVVQTAEVPRHRPIALEHNSEAGEFFAQTPTLLSGYDLASLIIINDQRCATPPRPGAPSTRAHAIHQRHYMLPQCLHSHH
jgi:hypothetical protein